jgi:hypothetical protein
MKKKIIELVLIISVFSLVRVNSVLCQQSKLSGTISGKLVDADTKEPLPGANVTIEETFMGAATDLEGNFTISKVPVGSYTLQFRFIGYETLLKTDVIVRSKRITFINAELHMSVLEMDGVVVTGGYFSDVDEQPTSSINFSYEEIRRAPGSAGDVSRILMSLPSVAKVNDQSNNLIVRGGNPIENTFFIDNIEMPNINHFPHQGASGGPIGMLNVDFIQDVNFYAGGFSAIYGDILSSIMDLTFREGNRSEFDGQLDLNFSGFGGVAEGPLFNNKGSWLFSARRSYLDFVVDVFEVGSTIAPIYGDIQGKLVYDLNPNHKLIILGVFADDHNAPDRETGEENYMTHYGNQDLYQSTVGINWRSIWNKSGYSNTSVAYTSNKFNEDFYETTTGIYDTRNRSQEQSFKFRNVNHFRLNKRNTVEFGVEAKHLAEEYDNWYGETNNAFGDTVPALTMQQDISAQKLAAFVNYIAKPFNRLTTTLGLRADYFSYSENVTVSPRFACSYQLSSLTSINGAVGIFHQNLPLLLLSQHESNKELRDPMAVHYILGIDHLITGNTKLTLEVYQKDYQRFPMDALQPALFIIDESYFDNYGSLIDNGKALSRGVEIMIQKKLAQNFYGLASASFFRSRYQGGDGIWRDRNFDNRVTFSVEGGYKPNRKWEFSMRWIYAGGVPYTSFDIEQSKANHRPVYDENQVNTTRYPDYHSMNIRFDRRFHFSGSNLVFYLSAWNIYNHKNIANYFWNDKEQKQDEVYQWLLLPIFGLEYEF